MCGITGYWHPGGARPDLPRFLATANDTLAHRGPDGSDIWVDEEAGLGFGHRRLSIIDLSENGRQPMISSCGRIVLTYNGEVYNAPELRRQLEAAGRSFRGHSDTEAIVEGCAEWGVAETVGRLIGMFAFAVWDRQARTLSLVRDRIGIKPLYWSQDGTGLIFGSELKALRSFPSCPRDIDRDAVAAYLRHNYIPAPRTIYRNVQKLAPGHILTWSGGREAPEIAPYWSLEQALTRGRADPVSGSDDETIEALSALLSDAVGARMVADVPLGAFLSGGIDSSTVVALMQAQSSRPVKSFSIGFDEAGFDEAKHAAAVAAHLGTDHTELYVTPSEARDVIPKLPEMYDEPFADSSQIPTHLVSALTRKSVTVALSGDGGDELFAGYTRYFTAARLGRTIGRVPRPLRQLAGAAIRAVPPDTWTGLFRALPRLRNIPQPGDRLHKLADVLPQDADGYYRRLISHWTEPDSIARGGTEPKGIVWDPAVRAIAPDRIDRMQYLDTLTYLPDDILTKVDRASMAVSLEARVPLLDHRVVEFAWRLPRHFKIRDGQGKWILRRVLDRFVPTELIDRPKMGFGVPIGTWLRGPLRDWGEALLSEAALDRHGLLESAPVRRAWAEHQTGHRNWQYQLWDVLMLQAWCEHQAGA